MCIRDRVDGVQSIGGRNAAIEPRANYSVLRLQRDHADGRGDIGLMLTGVNRALDAGASPFLASGAYSGGLDFRRRFVGNNYAVSYTHLRAHETPEHLVCRLLLE